MLRRHDWTNSNASPQPWWQPILFPCQPTSGMMAWAGDGDHERSIPTAVLVRPHNKQSTLFTPMATARMGGEGEIREHRRYSPPAHNMPSPEKPRGHRATSATEQNSKKWFEQPPCRGKHVRWNSVVRFRVIPAVQDIADKASMWWAAEDIREFCCHERRRRLVASETGCTHDFHKESWGGAGLEVEEMVVFQKTCGGVGAAAGDCEDEAEGVLLPLRRLAQPLSGSFVAQEEGGEEKQGGSGGGVSDGWVTPPSDDVSPSGTMGEVFKSPLDLSSPRLKQSEAFLTPSPSPSSSEEDMTQLSSSPSSPPPAFHSRPVSIPQAAPPPLPLTASSPEFRPLTWPVNQASHLFHAAPFVMLPTPSATSTAAATAGGSAPLAFEEVVSDAATVGSTGGALGEEVFDCERSNNNHDPALQLMTDDRSRISVQLDSLLSDAKQSNAIAIPKSGGVDVAIPKSGVDVVLDALVEFGWPGLVADSSLFQVATVSTAQATPSTTPTSLCELTESNNLQDLNRKYGQHRLAQQRQQVCEQEEEQQEDGHATEQSDAGELHELERNGPLGPLVF